ncbi:MAG: CDP-alcohol phosphatidyltransferase family protein [Spirochaetes bacterium]|nr:CDP-alcohol phosphatidyltransferase family protein [Spirochaetota bacterium]
MVPETVLIKSEKTYNFKKKLCGLYPLERNIVLLFKAGVKKIYLDLSDDEKNFFEKKINKHLKKLNSNISITDKKKSGSTDLSIPANIFMQVHHFSDFDKFFKKEKKNYIPVLNDKQFLLETEPDFKNAVKLVKSYIIKNTGGFIAQKINKRLSMPVSSRIANTRIHPNYLTFVNILIGLMSGILLLFNTYWHIVFGGLLFQLASIMDGVDGEVAKFTFKFSKLGAWLDTLSDNLTLLVFIAGCSYLYYINTNGIIPVIVIALAFAGLITMIFSMVRYLRKYSDNGSLVTYDREFLQNLPPNDPFVIIANRLKYFTKKEFFSIVFFIICLTGKAHYIIPVIATVLFIASIILVVLNAKYLKNFSKVN